VLCVVSKDKKAKHSTIMTKKQVRIRYKVKESAKKEDGIATRYGLDGPVIQSRWGRDFPHPSRLPLGSTQPPVQLVPGHSRG
jgi:hypothetical protein